MPETLGRFIWTSELNRFGWQAFLGAEPGGAGVAAAGVPARTTDLSGLPATFIGVGGLDLFVEEDVDYGRRLIAAGVPTELPVAPRAYHGFNMLAGDAAVSRRFNAARIDALRRAVA